MKNNKFKIFSIKVGNEELNIVATNLEAAKKKVEIKLEKDRKKCVAS